MTTHAYDIDMAWTSEDALLQGLMSHPARIPMLDMRSDIVIALRDRGLILMGQEMVNCIGIHDASGDIIIQGEPSLFAWIVLSKKGRAFMQAKLSRDPWQIEADRMLEVQADYET